MSPKPHATITKHFSSLKDPRVERTKLHSLSDILVIAICASICGANTWIEVEAWGIAKKKWLKRFLELPNGIPRMIPLDGFLRGWIPSSSRMAS
jgi:hypothetical protein